MSSFFGIFNPNGIGVNGNVLNQLDRLTNQFNSKKIKLYSNEYIALASVSQNEYGDLLGQQQPLKSSCGRYIISGYFRLDYRDELADKLGIQHFDLIKMSDSNLVLLSFLKWGYAFLKKLEGDFSFVLYNMEENEILLVRQPCGYSAIYYTTIGEQLIFSDTPKFLIEALGENNKINIPYLLGLSMHGSIPLSFDTMINGISTLRNGFSFLWKTPHDFKLSQFWKFKDSRTLRFKFLIDYFFELRSFFSMSVKSRISENKNGLLISSGLDSTAVGFYLINELKHRNQILETYTSFPYYLDELSPTFKEMANEVPLVEKFLNKFQNVKSFYVNYPEFRVSDLLKLSLKHDLHYPVISANSGWINYCLNLARRNGVFRVFNAQAGNITISYTSQLCVLESLMNGSFKMTFRNLVFYSRVREVSLWISFKELIVKPFYFIIRRSAKKLFRTFFSLNDIRKKVKGLKSISKIYFYIKSEFFILDRFGFLNSRELRKKQLEVLLDFVSHRWYIDSSNYDVQSCDPTSDSRLINLTFSLPKSLFFNYGTHKYLYLNTFNDLFGNSINMGKNKIQSFDIGYRIFADKELHKVIDKMSQDPLLLDTFDFGKFSLLFQKITDSKNSRFDFIKISSFLRLLGLMNFYYSKNNNNFMS